MKTVSKQFRQGDVLITPATIPADAMKRKSSTVTLAEGEATGHAHRIVRPGRKMDHYEHEGVMYLRVHEPVTVEHEEHAPATLEPGDYVVRRQVEVWIDEVRRVAD